MPLSSTGADATVWDLVLQHCCETPRPVGAQKLICTLLQVSKGLLQAVVRQFQGQMHVAATINNLQQAESFARWLSDPRMALRGHIISKLRLDIACRGTANKQAEMLIAAALQSAAGAPDAVQGPDRTAPEAAVSCLKLLVSDYKTTSPSIVITKSLAAAVTQLTSMWLSFYYNTCSWTQESMLELGKAIGSLSSLRHLHLCGYDRVIDQHPDGGFFMGCDFLVIGLSSLTTLTSLDMQEVATTGYLPVQLRELTYNCFRLEHPDAPWSYGTYYEHRSESPVFAGLTALTKLTFDSGTYVDYEINTVTREIDIVSMPPNLLELHMPGISSNEAVLQCRHLTRLVLEDCKMAARELQALTSLSDLREMRLSHAPDGGDCEEASCFWHNYAVGAAKAWKLLPLRSLKFVVDLCEIIEHDAESNAIDHYAASRSFSNGHDQGDDRRSRNIMLLDQLALQTGLTCLELDVHICHPEVFEQLGLLHAPLRHLTHLRELYLGAADPGYCFRTGLSIEVGGPVRVKVDRKICQGHGLLCRVIAALPELILIKLDWMPVALARHMRMQLLADNSKAKLCINPKLRLDAD